MNHATEEAGGQAAAETHPCAGCNATLNVGNFISTVGRVAPLCATCGTRCRTDANFAGLVRVSVGHGHTWPGMQRALRAAGCAIPRTPIALAGLVQLVAPWDRVE